MWRTDSAVPEIAPAPASAPSSASLPEPVPAVMPAIAPVVAPAMAPVGGPGSQLPGRFSGTVSLTKLLKYKGKSSRARNGVMVVLGIALVAGAVKLMVSSGAPKVATAAPEPSPAPAPATQPATKPAKAKTVLTADANGSNAKPIPRAGATAKSKSAATDSKFGKKPAASTPTAPQTGITPAGAKSANTPGKSASRFPPAPKSAAPAAVSAGGEYVDKTAGYSVRFPAGWTQRSLGGRGSWLAEASDGKASSMAVGFAPDGGHAVADATNLAALTKSYQARPDTIVQGAGFGTVAGRKCMWHKLSVPAPGGAGVNGGTTGANASASAARISTVQYFTPLGDGRALKVRVVSRPETFAAAAPTMKQSLDTLRLLAPAPAGKQVAAGQ